MFDLVSFPMQELPFELWFFGPSASRPLTDDLERSAHPLFISSVKHGLICLNGGMPKNATGI